MKLKILLVLLLLGLAAAALWWVRVSANAAGGAGLKLFGNVDIREVNLGFRVGGKLAEVLRDEGDSVKPGDPLARLDDEPIRREVEQARAQAAALQARAQWLQKGYRAEEITQARAVVHEREATLANAERLFQRQQQLLKTKAIAEQDLEEAQARFREAQARLNSARAQLALLEAGFRPEEIAQATADVARAQAVVAAAELRLNDTVLRAPAQGVVITRAQEPGAVVQPGATVLTLSLNRPVWARAYVSEPDLGRVHPGQPVRVFTDSRPDKPYSGQIGYISPRAEFTPKSVETAELRTSLVYRLRVVVTDPDEGLRQGMPVTLVVPAP